MKIWFNGNIIEEKKVKISPLSHALHYGTAAFEGIRFYKTIYGTAIFRINEHLKRLFYSAGNLSIKIPWSLKTIELACKQTIKANGLKEGYIRPIVWYGEGGLGINPSGLKVNGAIIVLPWGKYIPKEIIKVKTVKIKRFSPLSFDPNAKVAGHYVNSVRAHLEAKRYGYDEALLLDDKGYVTECSGENIFIVKNKTLFTPPTGNILPGITRDSIITLAKDMKIPVKEKLFALQECQNADECFLTGTAAEVTPVGKIDDSLICNNNVGEITYALQTLYGSAVRGNLKKYNKWLVPIT